MPSKRIVAITPIDYDKVNGRVLQITGGSIRNPRSPVMKELKENTLLWHLIKEGFQGPQGYEDHNAVIYVDLVDAPKVAPGHYLAVIE